METPSPKHSFTQAIKEFLSSDTMNIVEMTQNVAGLLKKYRELLIHEYKGRNNIPPEICDLISWELARLTKMIIPNVHQKLDEVIVAAEQKTPHIVSPDQHGADLIEKGTNSKTEVKVSVCSRSYANFNWSLPSRPPNEEEQNYKARVRDSIFNKTAHGGAILRIEGGLGEVIAQYRLSCAFLLEYFSRLKINPTHKHNMRSEQCGDCGKFHRIQKLAYWSKVFDRQPDKVDWDDVFTKTPPHCKNHPYRYNYDDT